MKSPDVSLPPAATVSNLPDNWDDRLRVLEPRFAERAAATDETAGFVAANYAELKELGFFAAMIPAALGGGGVSHSGMCDLLRRMARSCASTALACSMHQHLVAAIVWRHQHGDAKAGDTLRMIAAKRLVLVSTGARDWLESNGGARKVDGGYLVSGLKAFASQCVVGDLLVTSAPYADPAGLTTVLHFAVSLASPGVSILDDWRTLGMRGTGSCSVRLEDVFIPDSAVTLQRPQGRFHPVFNVVLGVAMPLIMAVYVGIAQQAVACATAELREQSRSRRRRLPALAAMNNELVDAELNWRDMVRLACDLQFAAEDRIGHEIATRKVNVANHCISVVGQAMAIAGGRSFYRQHPLERLFRDVQAAQFHPMPAPDQLEFSGEFLLRDAPVPS